MCQLRAPAAGLGPATHKAHPCREVRLAGTAQRRSSLSRISSAEGLEVLGLAPYGPRPSSWSRSAGDLR